MQTKVEKKTLEVKNITPTHLPFKCPVCTGYGSVGRDPERYLCHGCEGLGWVTVEQTTTVDGSDII